LEARKICKINWWVDALYAIHHDMRSHTGGDMIIGKGELYATSTRQKLTTKIVWTRYFLQHQGITIIENKLSQDNRSAIILEKNGRQSSSKRTKQINVFYFFVTNRIDS
jgi:hypothetical protein